MFARLLFGFLCLFFAFITGVTGYRLLTEPMWPWGIMFVASIIGVIVTFIMETKFGD